MPAPFQIAFATIIAVAFASQSCQQASAQYGYHPGPAPGGPGCSSCDSGYANYAPGPANYASQGQWGGHGGCDQYGPGGQCAPGGHCGSGGHCGQGSYFQAGCKSCGSGYGCGGGCCRTNSGYFVVDALFLDRTQQSDSRSLVLDNQTLDEELNTNDLDFNMMAGVRATLGLKLANCKAIELTYFGLQDWDETQIVQGDDNLRIPGELALASTDFLDADQIQVDYSAHIDNGEVNLVHTNSRLSVLGGFRYLGLTEFMRINSFDVDTGSSDYIIQTANDLFGGQIGVRWNKCVGPLNVKLTSKGGLFFNDASQLQFVSDLDNGFNFRNSRGDDTTSSAFIIDLGVDAGLCLTEFMSLRGGYNLMWVDRLALAPDQLDFTDTPFSGTGISTNGNAFFHGFNAGFEIRK